VGTQPNIHRPDGTEGRRQVTLTHDLAIVEALRAINAHKTTLNAIENTATRGRRRLYPLCQLIAIEIDKMAAVPVCASVSKSPLKSPAFAVRSSDTPDPTSNAAMRPDQHGQTWADIRTATFATLRALDASSAHHMAGEAESTVDALRSALESARKAVGLSWKVAGKHVEPVEPRKAVELNIWCVACGHAVLRPRRGYCDPCYSDWRLKVVHGGEDQGRWEQARKSA
jgi:hypothetical protein